MEIGGGTLTWVDGKIWDLERSLKYRGWNTQVLSWLEMFWWYDMSNKMLDLYLLGEAIDVPFEGVVLLAKDYKCQEIKLDND